VGEGGQLTTVLAVAFLAAALLSGLVRRYALAAGILDRPTARSSHAGEVPRGGGLGVMAAIFLALGSAAALGHVPSVRLTLPLGGVLLVSAVGWLDDRDGLSVRARLAVHVAAGLSLLPLVLAPTSMPEWLGVGAGAWWLFWAVSSINVVNFMDGIDGLITSQAVIFGLHLMLLGGPSESSGLVGLVMAGACIGFLLWNWAPAKIFLGDVGSGALGFMMVLGGAFTMREGNTGFAAAFLPLYALFLDATATLALRVLRGEDVSQPHRSHLYQVLANGGWGHGRVSLLYGATALVGVAVAGWRDAPGWWGMMVAYAAVVLALGLWLRRRSRAGGVQEQSAPDSTKT
jgi:Fuc2NAc and GlcNAc transferase